MKFSSRRCYAFFIKESIQVVRDPSSIMIAFILPLILLFLWGYGISLDTNMIRIGVVMEDTAPEARSLAYAFSHTKFFEVTQGLNRKDLVDQMIRSKLRGVVVIPEDFSDRVRRQDNAKIQVIADGSETNTANFVRNYAEGVMATWLQGLQLEGDFSVNSPIETQTQVWYNPELKSRYVLLPGSIAITMTLIGILLTALVVAREWERGSMESLLTTSLKTSEFIIGKLGPYFILGLGSMLMCLIVSTTLFTVPFRGSYWVLFASTSLFLVAGLGIGFLISTTSKNQYVATQMALFLGFLPSFILSGVIYEISSMPMLLRGITYMVPARYFVSILQCLYLSGNAWGLLLPNLFGLAVIASVIMWLIRRKISSRLE